MLIIAGMTASNAQPVMNHFINGLALAHSLNTGRGHSVLEVMLCLSASLLTLSILSPSIADSTQTQGKRGRYDWLEQLASCCHQLSLNGTLSFRLLAGVEHQLL